MFDAWNFRPIEIFYLSCAVIGGILFLIRIFLYIIGGAGADTDIDVDMNGDFHADLSNPGDHPGDAHHGAEAGFKLVSVQGVTGFFLMFGLIGLAMARGGIHDLWTIAGGAGAGFITMLAIAWAMLSMQKLQSSGTLKMENAIGREGKVYLTIPADGTGKVSVAVQGSLREFEAVAADKTAISTGTPVRVVRLSGSRILVVERID